MPKISKEELEENYRARLKSETPKHDLTEEDRIVIAQRLLRIDKMAREERERQGLNY